MEKTNIYVLKLQGNKYYVGKSQDVIGRYQQHMNGQGSAWTKKYKPMSLVESRDGVSPLMEDMVTKEYMAKYGIDKVRGGSYVGVELDEVQEYSLQKEIWGAKDCCTNCGRNSHFVKDCYATTDVKGNSLKSESESESEESEDEYECEYCERTFNTEYGCSVHERSCKEKSRKSTRGGGSCYTCGRQGHFSPDCYATRHIKGYEL
jgi:predicted GIY-YIG superfamily endonuclease